MVTSQYLYLRIRYERFFRTEGPKDDRVVSHAFMPAADQPFFLIVLWSGQGLQRKRDRRGEKEGKGGRFYTSGTEYSLIGL